MSAAAVEIRRASAADAAAIAAAHLDSIRSLGSSFYPPGVVADWTEGVSPQLYLNAMEAGEVFFVAVGDVHGDNGVLGFASEYRIEGTTHGTSVYVRGIAARRGIGSSLLRMAEAHALSRGAACVRIEASLSGVDFYRVNGYVELQRGQTRLSTGRSIAVVFMHKDLAPR
jgi:putative acetyltransferase